MMKYRRMSSVTIIVMSLFLYACGTTVAGPQAWIDIPMENTNFPLETLNIMAHASDADGVASFEFYVNDQNILSVATIDHKRLESMQIQWTPPGPGTYMIGVRGISNNGTAGAMATSRVNISGTVTITPPVQQIARETSTSTVTVTVTATNTPITPPPPSETSVIANLDANCREGPGTAFEVYGNLIKGQDAVIKGRLADNSWFLIAIAGRSMNCWIAASIVDVSGNLDVVQIVPAPAAPPVAGVEPPPVDILPPAVIDASPPVFANISIAPNSIITEGGGCPNQSRTATVAAAVGDTSGLNEVTAHWHIGSAESGVAPLTLGGLAYWATIGPVHNAGTMEIYIYAEDTLGYGTNSGKLYVTVQDCPG